MDAIKNVAEFAERQRTDQEMALHLISEARGKWQRERRWQPGVTLHLEEITWQMAGNTNRRWLPAGTIFSLFPVARLSDVRDGLIFFPLGSACRIVLGPGVPWSIVETVFTCDEDGNGRLPSDFTHEHYVDIPGVVCDRWNSDGYPVYRHTGIPEDVESVTIGWELKQVFLDELERQLAEDYDS